MFGSYMFGVMIMPIKEVCSPINVKAGKTSGNISGFSPGARSMPGAGERKDSVPPQPSDRMVSRGSEREPPLRESTKVVGPED